MSYLLSLEWAESHSLCLNESHRLFDMTYLLLIVRSMIWIHPFPFQSHIPLSTVDSLCISHGPSNTESMDLYIGQSICNAISFLLILVKFLHSFLFSIFSLNHICLILLILLHSLFQIVHSHIFPLWLWYIIWLLLSLTLYFW